MVLTQTHYIYNDFETENHAISWVLLFYTAYNLVFEGAKDHCLSRLSARVLSANN